MPEKSKSKAPVTDLKLKLALRTNHLRHHPRLQLHPRKQKRAQGKKCGGRQGFAVGRISGVARKFVRGWAEGGTDPDPTVLDRWSRTSSIHFREQTKRIGEFLPFSKKG